MAFKINTILQVAHSMRSSAPVVAGVLLLPALASGQQRDDMLFSVSWRGPSVGGGYVSAGDILGPDGGLTQYQATMPMVARPDWQLGLSERDGCNPAEGIPCGDEVDALSLGADVRLPMEAKKGPRLFFSVDSNAVGAGVPLTLPSVTSEAMFFDQGASVFSTHWVGDLRYQDALATGSNHLKIDGNGIGAANGAGFQQYGAGLREPNPQGGRWPYSTYDRGDDLDALSLGQSPLSLDNRLVYLSLQGELPDPMDPQGTPTVPSSAGLVGFSGADILASSPSVGLSLYASAESLGLDPELDDVDAILIAENGNAGYQPSGGVFGWLTTNTDMVLFSVRRGSAIIGKYDSWLGFRICEGDLLAPPRSMGLSPAIVVTAEAMGLRSSRSTNGEFGDDLDATSTDPVLTGFLDCNENGIEDRLDIVDKTSYDFNENGIPDECEYDGEDFCTCPLGAGAGCANDQPYRGCGNVTGEGARLACIGPANMDDVFGFTVYGLPPSATAVLILGGTQSLPAQWGNGLACITPQAVVGGVRTASAEGTVAYLPGILAGLGISAPSTGETGFFQLWYRDSAFGGCNDFVNWSNGLALTL